MRETVGEPITEPCASHVLVSRGWGNLGRQEVARVCGSRAQGMILKWYGLSLIPNLIGY